MNTAFSTRVVFGTLLERHLSDEFQQCSTSMREASHLSSAEAEVEIYLWFLLKSMKNCRVIPEYPIGSSTVTYSGLIEGPSTPSRTFIALGENEGFLGF